MLNGSLKKKYIRQSLMLFSYIKNGGPIEPYPVHIQLGISFSLGIMCSPRIQSLFNSLASWIKLFGSLFSLQDSHFVIETSPYHEVLHSSSNCGKSNSKFYIPIQEFHVLNVSTVLLPSHWKLFLYLLLPSVFGYGLPLHL